MIFEKQVLAMYRNMAFSRCDDEGTAYYFSAKDFDGLLSRPYYFKSSKGHILRGCFYSCPQPVEKRLIVFDHGFGGGHRSYMKEIERLCKAGYLVFAYDHTGCMESEGKGANGMSQSLCDLNDCLNAIKADTKYADMDISVVGHSWGGFSTMNICALHPYVSHIVVLAGFVSVEKLVGTFFDGIMKPFRKPVMELERATNPDFVDFDGTESLANTDAKVMLIYSDNDMMCKSVHFEALKAALEKRPNVTIVLESEKGHNPNYTIEAVKYLAEYQAELKKMKKKLDSPKKKADFVDKWDWNKMTEQDEAVWEKILEHLK